MNTRALLTFSIGPIFRSARRWWIRQKIRHLQFQIAHLQQQRANDFHAERVLMGRQAFLRAELIDL